MGSHVLEYRSDYCGYERHQVQSMTSKAKGADELGYSVDHHSTLIMFADDPAMSLGRAADILEQRGLCVEQDEDGLRVRWGDGPVLRVFLTREPHVRIEAAEIGEGTPHLDRLRECDARFEVSFDDLDEVLDEINTLIEVQATLQDATSGFQFNTWNFSLSPPSEEDSSETTPQEPPSQGH